MYPEAISLSADNATQAQLEEAFAPLTGSTRRKAVAFFLKAAEYAMIPLSAYFKAPREPGRPKGTKAAKRKPRNGPPKKRDEVPLTPNPEEDQRARYVDLLMKRVESGDDLDGVLLDRIERLLGFAEPDDIDDE